ncbi:hypothetical protein T484DRAFT_1794957 [Baffinella frigidus]|nr:hypothetical protein T484DRAFT_1794957 [Cryptophyta sp. CCMP2293]
MASVSEDAMWASQGGTMQIWRPLDFVSRDPNDCLAQIDKLQLGPAKDGPDCQSGA